MKINYRKAFICGIKGLKLNNKEISFLKKYKPWGIILFSRNIKNINQTKLLISNIKKIFNDTNYPVIIDEEGGSVSRLKNLIDNSIFTAEYFGKLFTKDRKKFKIYFKVYIKQISHIFKNLGININSVPVLDLRRKITSKVIGNRSYSYNYLNISKIGNYCISYFKNQKIGTIMKHMPGHGLAKHDSHKIVPLVKNPLSELKKDFYVFKKKDTFFAMTAHVVYTHIDPLNTATHSKKVINLIRNKIKFKNIIISDDISMKALKYSISINTVKAFSAGCNIVLHCNGNMKEMLEVAKNSPSVDKFIIKKTLNFINMVS